MSWKSIVSAGLLCIVASPSLAATASATLLGLDVNGNWVWSVSVDPNENTFINHPTLGNGGSIAIEFAATATGRGVVSAGANTTNFPSANPGTAPAGWGNNIDGQAPNPDEGVAYSAATDRVVAYLGSAFFSVTNGFATPGAPKEAFRIHTERPITGSTATTLTFTGAWNANGELSGTLGFIAEQGVKAGIDLGQVTGNVRGGNTNLDGIINAVDGGELVTRWQQAGAWRWQDGDFNGDGVINAVDGGEIVSNWQQADPNWTTPGAVNLPAAPGAGGGGLAGAITPEPSSLILLGFGVLAAALRSRRRIS